MNEETKMFPRKRRVYYRLMADGTCVGPAHTQAYLHLMVRTYVANEAAKPDRVAAYYPVKWNERLPEDKDRDTSAGFWDYRL